MKKTIKKFSPELSKAIAFEILPVFERALKDVSVNYDMDSVLQYLRNIGLNGGICKALDVYLDDNTDESMWINRLKVEFRIYLEEQKCLNTRGVLINIPEFCLSIGQIKDSLLFRINWMKERLCDVDSIEGLDRKTEQAYIEKAMSASIKATVNTLDGVKKFPKVEDKFPPFGKDVILFTLNKFIIATLIEVKINDRGKYTEWVFHGRDLESSYTDESGVYNKYYWVLVSDVLDALYNGTEIRPTWYIQEGEVKEEIES